MIVAARLVRDRRRSMLWWLLGVLGLTLFTVALYPSVQGVGDVDELVRNLPAAFRNVIGYDAAVPLTSPAGYLHTRLFSTVAPVLFVVFAIGLGAQAIGGIEEAGRLEPLLANPVTRARFAAERAAASVGLLAALVAAFAAATAGLAAPFGILDPVRLGPVTPGGLFGACAALFALALLHLSLAYAVGAATGRRGPAVGVAAAVAVGGYLVYSLLALVRALAPLRFVTPWYWYLQRNILTGGLPAAAIAVPVAASGVLFVLGWVAFRRRDLR